MNQTAPATSNSEVVLTRVFAAPIQRVWDAITTPAAMAKWYFDVPEFRPEVGCQFGFACDHEGHRWVHECRVTEVAAPTRLAYTWRYPDHPGESLVTFELTAEGEQTRLTLRHTGLDTFPKIPQFDRANFNAGWTSIIGEDLKAYLEGTSAQ